ncbi:TauD/TfdA family dioxygenase [Saccharothrix sp. Mg75]|uniref:TauD/TfdA family dioxygenase n=1 Tax=Saccharothrix sp. Mg75 TaxID=3445357 RepID=UPI003EEA636B
MDTRSGSGAPAFRLVEPGPAFTVPVRGRAFLAGSAHRNFPETVPDVGPVLPTLAADGAGHPPDALAAAVRDVVDEALPKSGGVLLRGLPLTDKAGFEGLIGGLGYDRAGYEGGIAVRKQDSGAALNASQEDRRITLSPHNEMAYLPTYPRKIFFFCESEATSGGEVPVNDVRETAAIIPDDVKDAFREKGVRYHRNLAKESGNGEMGWVDTFRTEDRAAVEEHLVASGYEFAWDADEGLRYHYARDAFTAHPDTGEELWFNQVTELHCSYWRSHPGFPPDLPDDAYPATTTYGDGSPIDEDLISYLRGALWRTARAVRMRRGDVLVLDNQVYQHGRFAFEGPRRHFVSLAR